MLPGTFFAMTRTTFVAAAATLVLSASGAAAQEPVRWADLDRALVEADSFAFRVNGQQMGVQVLTLQRTEDGLRFEETSSMAQVTQTTEVLMSEPLAMRSVRQRGIFGGREARVDVEYGAERATGTALTPAAGPTEVTIDAPIVAGAVDDNVLTALLPAIDWTATTDVIVPIFHSGRNTTAEMRLRVSGTETVEVPAGSFETWRVESSGDEAPLVFFIESAAPHRLVRLEIGGAPVDIVRLN